MDIKKQAIIILGLVLAVGLGQLGYKYLFTVSTPSQVALSFLENHQDYLKAQQYVTASDAVVLSQIHNDYLTLTKIPNEALTASVAADVTLSDAAHKIDLQTNKGVISLNLIKVNDNWLVFLNLKQIYQIKQLLDELKDAEVREDEVDLLHIYTQLNELLPSSLYQEKIDTLNKYITNKKMKEEYVKNVYISALNLRHNLLTGLIQNQGDLSLKTIKASLQIINPTNGLIDQEFPITLYEVIPGSVVFGEPIKPHYQKKFGLNLTNLTSLKNLKDLKNLTISVTGVEFNE